MKRKEIKTINNFIHIGEILDETHNHLCYKLHDLELSHNRKIKLLQQIKKYFNHESDYNKTTLLRKIEDELQFIGRINGAFKW